MSEFLNSTFFSLFLVPTFVALLGAFIKGSSRNDKHSDSFFLKEDWAVGFDLTLASIVALILHGAFLCKNLASPPPSEKLLEALVLVSVMSFMMWGLSMIVRRAGWKKKNQLNFWVGVILPDVFGVFSLLITVYWIKS